MPPMTCNSLSNCPDQSAGTACDLSVYPVGFLVVSGPNAGSLGFVTTGVDGTASQTYTDTNGAGTDVIQACVDTDMIGDDSSPGGHFCGNR